MAAADVGIHPLVRTMLIWLAIVCAGCAGIATGSATGNRTLSATAGTTEGAAGAGLLTADSDARLQEDRDAALYQIYVDSDGRLIDPVTGKPVPRAPAAGATARREEQDEDGYVAAIFDNLRKHPDHQLTVFIHGGLNSFESATERVKRFKDRMLAEKRYPLFISWDAGWPGNYRDHLFYLRRGIVRPVLGVLSSPVVLVEDVARAVVRIPASTYQVAFGHRMTQKERQALERSVSYMTSSTKILLHGPSEAEEDAAAPIHTWSDPLWWNPVKLVAAPLIDGFGTGAWDSMLRRTDLVLRKQQDDDYDEGVTPGTAASKFFRRLEKESARPGIPIGGRQPVTLVGHSMGAIIANNIISKYQQINFSRIVYMAAACRVKDLDNVVAPYLLRNASAEFFNLSLNTRRDIGEHQAWDFVPRGSLLLWIDQTLGDVNSFQDRTAGYWPNIARSAPGIFDDDELAGRVHLTMFGSDPPNPLEHGDFGQFRFWRPGFWTRSDCTALDDAQDTPCFASSPISPPPPRSPSP